MTTITKRGTVFAIALLMLVMSIFVPMRKAKAAMMYNNLTSANIYCSVNSSGELQALLSVSGIKGRTTQIHVELYVEKKILGLFWSRVDIGYTNNVWVDSTTNHTYSHSFITSLPSTGTYRTTVTFTVSGTGGSDDVIVKTDTVTH